MVRKERVGFCLGRRQGFVFHYATVLTIFLLSIFDSFGYVVEGADFLSAIKEGDVVVSAKVVEGADNLKLPQ
jgi:cyclophilin family peptidyl-prolyl cis-trans isomerase